MSIFGKEVDSAVAKMNGMKIRPAEFEGNGLILQFKVVNRIKSQYGASEDSAIVEKGILEEGEQFQFDFVNAEGQERRLWSTSLPFFFAMQNAEINLYDWLHIRRSGKADKTRYTVEVVSAPTDAKPVSHAKLDYPRPGEDGTPNPDDIPF